MTQQAGELFHREGLLVDARQFGHHLVAVFTAGGQDQVGIRSHPHCLYAFSRYESADVAGAANGVIVGVAVSGHGHGVVAQAGPWR
jgi:hypothetical protein